jgi:hypothetical protein
MQTGHGLGVCVPLPLREGLIGGRAGFDVLLIYPQYASLAA